MPDGRPLPAVKQPLGRYLRGIREQADNEPNPRQGTWPGFGVALRRTGGRGAVRIVDARTVTWPTGGKVLVA